MKILKRKIPVAISLALVFVTGAIAYTFGYKIAIDKFNSIVSYSQEREQMYYKLSQVDHVIRQEYINNIDETKLDSGLCLGYVSGLNDDCKYLDRDEYKAFTSKVLYDENAVEHKELEGKIGYVKINSVTPEMGAMFSNAVQDLIKAEIDKIIVDIRNLSGKDVESVGKCLNFITEKGYTINEVDKKGNRKEVYKTNSDRLDLKICALVNAATSGTPELIASAAKNSASSLVVGEVTKGKAIKEKAVPLSDGSGIIFPSAHYVAGEEEIPNGGVVPDVEISMDEAKNELLSRGELPVSDDDQLLEAIKAIMQI